MGCVNTITYKDYPRQKDKKYKYPQFRLGSRVKVYYHYNTKDYHYGTIVRDDIEEPYETIIKLDNGRYLRGAECQFSYTGEFSEVICMCKYCNEQNESIFYDKDSEGIREVVVEHDGTLSISSNDYDREESDKAQAIGFSLHESALMAQYSISVKINYCPMCGRKL